MNRPSSDDQAIGWPCAVVRNEISVVDGPLIGSEIGKSLRREVVREGRRLESRQIKACGGVPNETVNNELFAGLQPNRGTMK